MTTLSIAKNRNRMQYLGGFPENMRGSLNSGTLAGWGECGQMMRVGNFN